MFFGFGMQFARTGHTLALSARVARMFVNGEQGAWYDPSIMSTLFQDAAGTVPVTATGDPVGRILDISGRGNHATQATAGSRPTFRDVGGLRYLEFDGLDDFLVTAAINFTTTDEVSMFAGVRKLAGATMIFAELSADINANNGAFHFANVTGTNHFQFASRGTVVSSAISAGIAHPFSAVLTGTGDVSSDTSQIRVNRTMSSSATDQGAGNYGNHPLYIGRRGGASLSLSGHIYGLLIRGALTSQSGINAAERFMATKSGVILP